MMKVCIVAGARPNFMKIAPIVDAIDNHNRSNYGPIDYLIVHTGQHYDQGMSKLFFEDLGIPNPDINLEGGSASHAIQTDPKLGFTDRGGIQEETTTYKSSTNGQNREISLKWVSRVNSLSCSAWAATASIRSTTLKTCPFRAAS